VALGWIASAVAVTSGSIHDRRHRSIRTHHELYGGDRGKQIEVAVDAHGVVDSLAASGPQLIRSSSDARHVQRFHPAGQRHWNEILRARAQTLIEKDLSLVWSTDSDGLLEEVAFSPSETFAVMLQVSGLDRELTQRERDAYELHFTEYIHALAKAAKLDATESLSARVHMWMKFAKVCMEMAKPVQTEHFVASISHESTGWHAGVQESMSNLTWLEASMLAGVVEHSDPAQRINGSLQTILPQAAGSDSSWRSAVAEETFDAREEWKPCAAVLGMVKDQGQCGASWAQAAVSLATTRQCIAHSEAFMATSAAAMSTSYVMSCAGGGDLSGRGTCDGGSPIDALAFLAKHGSPSGGQTDSGGDTLYCLHETEGGALEHSQTPLNARPPCPSECFNRQFETPLQEDVTISKGLEEMIITRNVDEGKLAIRKYGSVLVVFTVHRDFFSYTQGVYRPLSNEVAGTHAAVAIGYGKDYILLVNSWGRDWGENGLFKLSTAIQPTFYIPGPLNGAGPLPLASGGASSGSSSQRSPSAGPDSSTTTPAFTTAPSSGPISQDQHQCTWIQTSTCRKQGAEVQGQKSCSASIGFGDKGFCDCNGNGIKDAVDPSYGCDSTPGTCSEACRTLASMARSQLTIQSTTSTAEPESTPAPGAGAESSTSDGGGETTAAAGETTTSEPLELASAEHKAGRFVKKKLGVGCSFNRDITKEPMCHAAAAELHLEWGGAVARPDDQRYCIFTSDLGGVVFNTVGSNRTAPLASSASICYIREPNYSYSLVGSGRCQDVNGTVAHATSLSVASTPLTNCEALCSSEPRCQGFANATSGCELYEDVKIEQSGGPSDGPFLCFKKGVQECGSFWSSHQGPLLGEPVTVESSCLCEVDCLVNASCIAWTFEVHSSKCMLHSSISDSGNEPCGESGCLAGRIGARPEGRAISSSAALLHLRSVNGQHADSNSSFWNLLDGPCSIDGDCILSPGYPSSYEAGQHCHFELVQSTVKVGGHTYTARMEVQDFVTERGFDVLTVMGKNYSGVVSPHGVTVSGPVLWSSDADVSHRGFRICINLNPELQPVQEMPAEWVSPEQIAETAEQRSVWAILSNETSQAAPCTIDDNLCIASPGLDSHGRYPDGSHCQIMVSKAGVRLRVTEFRTESYFDVLTVNGAHFSGDDSPDGITAHGIIHWSADDSRHDRGWKICPPVDEAEMAHEAQAQQQTGTHTNTGDAFGVTGGLWRWLPFLALLWHSM